MTAVANPTIAFFVRGRPQTKGSLHAWHRWRPDGNCQTGLSEQSGAALAEWRALIATAAKRAIRQQPPLSGPLTVALSFRFIRPKSQPFIEGMAPYVWGNKRWDIDKLQRAVLDALTDAALWKDDSQVSVMMAEKRYVEGAEQAGVRITIAPAERGQEC